MKKTLGLAIVFALCGCGSNPNTYQFSQELDQQVGEIAALRTHYRDQMSDHSFDLIRDRISLSGSYPHVGSPCVGAASDTYPTDAERSAIQHWAANRNAFLTQLAVLAKPTPNASERMARFMAQLDKANFEAAAEISTKIDDLSQGRLTYCQFAKDVRAINGEAHRQTNGYRNTLDEEALIDFRNKYGQPATKLIYAPIAPTP